MSPASSPYTIQPTRRDATRRDVHDSVINFHSGSFADCVSCHQPNSNTPDATFMTVSSTFILGASFCVSCHMCPGDHVLKRKGFHNHDMTVSSTFILGASFCVSCHILCPGDHVLKRKGFNLPPAIFLQLNAAWALRRRREGMRARCFGPSRLLSGVNMQYITQYYIEYSEISQYRELKHDFEHQGAFSSQ